MKVAVDPAPFLRDNDYSGLPDRDPSPAPVYAGALAVIAVAVLLALVAFVLLPYFYAWLLSELMP